MPWDLWYSNRLRSCGIPVVATVVCVGGLNERALGCRGLWILGSTFFGTYIDPCMPTISGFMFDLDERVSFKQASVRIVLLAPVSTVSTELPS